MAGEAVNTGAPWSPGEGHVEALRELPDDATVDDVGDALRGLDTVTVSRARRPYLRERLVSELRRVKAVSSPAAWVDELLKKAPTKAEAEPAKAAGAGSAGRQAAREATRPAEMPASEAASWPDGVPLSRDGSGRIRGNAGNAIMLVRYHPELAGRLRYNERYLRQEWVGAPPWDRGDAGGAVIDDDASWLAAWATGVVGMDIGTKVAHSAMAAEARRHPYEPVRDYLDGLEWDGTCRLAHWCSTYLGAQVSRYTSAVGRAWLVSAVARVYEPGCKADHMLVIEGPQGALKSSTLEVLGTPWFADLAIDPASKDTWQDIHGPWIIEWSDLAGHGRREAETLKSFLSRRTDRYRPSYGRIVEEVPRRCVFAGTTNESQYLGDPTGNRRYWPVRAGCIDIDALARDKGQLWAEAVEAYRSGCPWWLDAELAVDASAQQSERAMEDPWVQTIATMLHGRLTAEDFVSTLDVIRWLGLESSQQRTSTSRRISAIMTSLGWAPSRGRVDGVRLRGFRRNGDD